MIRPTMISMTRNGWVRTAPILLVLIIEPLLGQNEKPKAPAESATASGFTSGNHPRLASTLAASPQADVDGDGILTLAEYRAFLESPGKKTGKKTGKKQARGKQAKKAHPFPLLSNGDILITEFQERDINQLRRAGWKTIGDAFHRGPAHSTRTLRRCVGEFRGRYFISSLSEVDSRRRRRVGSIGTLISPAFEIELPYVEFLLSGGDHPGRICVRLTSADQASAGQVLRTVTGENDDTLRPVAFDVNEFRGRKVHLEIVDRHRGLWGHISVDSIRQTLGRTHVSTAPRLVSTPPETRGNAIIQTLDAPARSAREFGSIRHSDGKLLVGGKAISLDRILVASLHSVEDSGTRRGAVRTVGGEIWQADIRGIDKGQLTIRSALLGNRKIAISGVASVVFQFEPGDATGGEPGMLYRREGDPIPGKLVWIRDKDIAIDCALGVLPIPRPLVSRYVFRKVHSVRQNRDATRDAGADEVTLANGTRIRGSLTESDKGLVLNHAVLGALPLRWDQVSSVRRSPAGVSWLDQLAREMVERVGPVSSPPPPAVIETRIDRRDGSQAGLTALRIMPRTATRFSLPGPNSSWILHTRLAPIVGSRADLRVRIQVDGRLVWKGLVRAGAGSKQLTVKIPSGKAITIAVDFGEQLEFPCGVDCWDAHLLLEGSE